MQVTVLFLYSNSKKVIKNAHVGWLQKALKKLGYSITVDNSYGPATSKIVKKFQEDHGLTVDGYAGVKTHMKILNLLR